MRFSEYLMLPGLNWSRLKHMDASPLAFQYHEEHGTETTPSMRLGRVVHKLLLEPDDFGEDYVVHDKTKTRTTKAYKEERAEMDLAGDDRVIILGHEKDFADEMVRAVIDHPLAGELLEGGIKEQPITWTDPDTGVECKGLIDHRDHDLVDLKTARDVEPRAFGRQAAQLGYHGQLAYYYDGCIHSGLAINPDPLLVVVRNQAPIDVAVYRVAQDPDIEAGRKLYKRLLRLYVECRDSGVWPGVDAGSPDPLELHLPMWALERDEEIDITIGGKAAI